MPAAPPRPPFALPLVGALAALKLAVHLATNAWTPYGFHRDEFLYMAMGRHLALWRMEFPPAIAMLAELSRWLLGDSLVAVRLAPALAGAALVVLAALLARELGGGRYAQGLAAAAVLASPLFLRAANLFQPVVLDQLWWTLAFYALLRVGRAHFEGRGAPAPRWWIALGAAAGVALLTKFTAAFLAVAVLAGVVLTPLRAALATRWPWAALLVALTIGSPSLVGQLRLGFPVAGQMRDLRSAQLERVTAAEFVGGQLLLGPAALLALAGLVYLLRAEAARPYRAAGWACLAAFGALLVLHGKPYYLGPVYPLLFGAGGAALEAWTAGRGGGLRSRPRGAGAALRVAAVALVAAYGLGTLPLAIPLLAPPSTAAYASRLGITAAVRTNEGDQLPLPQDYADMLGWEAQVAAVARAYHALPPDQRARAVVIAGNYGEAGAIDFFGPRHGLPPAVCTAGTYWFFGPGDKPGDVVVTLGVERDSLARLYGTVTEVARVTNAWGVREEADVAVHVGEAPRHTLQALWPSFAGRN